MLPDTTLNRGTGFGGVSNKVLQVRRKEQRLGGKRGKFGLGIAVVAQGGGIERQELKRLQVINPHWLRIFIKQEPILFLGIPQLLFSLASKHNFMLKFVVGAVEFGGSFLYLNFKPVPHF